MQSNHHEMDVSEIDILLQDVTELEEPGLHSNSNSNRNRNTQNTQTQEYIQFLQVFLIQYHYHQFNRILCERAVKLSVPMIELYKQELETPHPDLWSDLFNRTESQNLLSYFQLLYASTYPQTPTLISTLTELSYRVPSFQFFLFALPTSTATTIPTPTNTLYPSLTYQEFVNYVLQESSNKSSIVEHAHLVNRIQSGQLNLELTDRHRQHSFVCDLKRNIITGVHCILRSRMYPYVAPYEIRAAELSTFERLNRQGILLESHALLEKECWKEIQAFLK